MFDETDIAVQDLDHAEVKGVRLRTVVAVPACNEAERIGACLDALACQTGSPVGRLGIVLFLNNCTDGTAAIVAEWRARCPHPVRVVERDAPNANAGWARREAMEAAAGWLREAGASDGVILTTDADSRVPRDWVALNLAAIDLGADAVAGRIALDPEEAARLPDALHARGRLEGEYEALLTELSALIDPEIHDPWPCHWTASGATLAVRASAYGRVGGMPAVPVGEDREFVARLVAHGCRVRHAPDVTVVTSGRLDGRAPGGAADTMKLRCEAPQSPCDPRLERLTSALIRYAWRARTRRLHAAGRLTGASLRPRLLGVRMREAAAIARLPMIGAVLAAAESASSRLGYRPLRPQDLPAQIGWARVALAVLRWAGRVRRIEGAMARRWLDERRLARPRAIGHEVEPVGPDTTS